MTAGLAEKAREPDQVRRPWRRGIVPKRVTADRTEIASLVGLLLVWEVVPRLIDLSWLPPLSQVVSALWHVQAEGVLWSNVGSSMAMLGLGLVISLVGGLGLGIAMARLRWIEVAFNAYIDILLFTPSLIFAPILFSFFGLGDTSRVAVVVMYAAPIVVVNTMTAVKTVDETLVDMARSFGLQRRSLSKRVLLPAAMPLTLEGIRLSIGRGIKGMITGEVLIALTGLGGLAAGYANRMATDQVWAVTLVVLIIALIANWLFTRVESRLTHWID